MKSYTGWMKSYNNIGMKLHKGWNDKIKYSASSLFFDIFLITTGITKRASLGIFVLLYIGYQISKIDPLFPLLSLAYIF